LDASLNFRHDGRDGFPIEDLGSDGNQKLSTSFSPSLTFSRGEGEGVFPPGK